MTGRDLIIYILQNQLEDTEILTDSNHMFLTVEETAVKYGTGIATVKAMIDQNVLKGMKIGETYLILNVDEEE